MDVDSFNGDDFLFWMRFHNLEGAINFQIRTLPDFLVVVVQFWNVRLLRTSWI